MGLIDWQAGRTPIQGSGPDVASLSSLVNVLYERRLRQQELAQQKAYHDAQLAEIARHNQAAEGIDRDQLAELGGYHQGTLANTAAHNAAMLRQGAGKEYRELVLRHQKGEIDDDAFAANMRSLGFDAPAPVQAPTPEPQQQAPAQSAPPPAPAAAPPVSLEPPAFNPDQPAPAAPAQAPPPLPYPVPVAGAPGAVMDASPSAAPSAPPQAASALPAGPGALLDAYGYDLGAAKKNREKKGLEAAAAIEAQAQQLINALPPGQRRYAVDAALAAIAEAKTALNQKPEKAIETFNKRFEFYLSQAGMDRRASLMARTQIQKVQSERPATGSDIDNVSRLESDLKNIDRLIADATRDPKAFTEFRNNQESWQRQEAASKNTIYGAGRAVLQGVGGARVVPEQGLDSPAAKRINGAHQKLRNSIAKGYGGVVTESDRDSADSELSLLANNPEEYVQNLMNVRERLKTNLSLYLQNKRLRGAAPPTATPSMPPLDDDESFLQKRGH